MSKQFEAGVTLLGGGPLRAADLSAALAYAPHLVCADGGANAVASRTPDLIVGDLDSLVDRTSWAARLSDNLIHDPDQDTTDFEKCLAHLSAPFVVGVGFLGGRIDHELAVLSALVVADRPIVLIGEVDVVFALRGTVTIETTPGQRVSIFPLMPVSARSEGLKWPLTGLALAAGGRIATSNEATGRHVTLECDQPGALIILPKDQLSNVLAAFGVV